MSFSPTLCDVNGCARPSPNSRVCPSCQDSLRSELRKLDERQLHDELIIAWARLDRFAVEPRGAERALVWRENIAETQWVVKDTLRAWCEHLWSVNANGQLELSDDLPEMARFLLRHPTWVANDALAGQLIDEVMYCIAQAWRAVDRPLDTRTFLGRCDLGEQPPVCDRELYATHRHQESVVCPACGSEWNVQERRDWLVAQLNDEKATAAVIAAALTRLGLMVTVAAIHQAGRRRDLVAADVDAHRRRRYRVGDVLDVLATKAG